MVGNLHQSKTSFEAIFALVFEMASNDFILDSGIISLTGPAWIMVLYDTRGGLRISGFLCFSATRVSFGGVVQG